jgi:hypothetical protein
MKVKMPVVISSNIKASGMQRCKLYLATYDGVQVTLIRLDNEVMMIEGTRISFISANASGKFDSAWLDRSVKIVREYEATDELTIAI